MKTFLQRTEEMVQGLSPMAKAVIPGTLTSLVVDMSKALDTLMKEHHENQNQRGPGSLK